MPAIEDWGPVPDRGIDYDMRKRTVKVTVRNQLSGMISRDFLKEAVTKHCEVTPENIEYIYKEEKMNIWFMTLKKEEDSHKIANKESCIASPTVDLYFERVDNQLINLRIHWIPSYVKNEFIASVFSAYGKVFDVQEEVTFESGMKTGVRTVKMRTNEQEKNNIPHLIRFGGGIQMLITMLGRLPLCLKCKQVGHNRYACESNMPKRRFQTYSDSVRTTTNRETMSHRYTEQAEVVAERASDPPSTVEQTTPPPQGITEESQITTETETENITIRETKEVGKTNEENVMENSDNIAAKLEEKKQKRIEKTRKQQEERNERKKQKKAHEINITNRFTPLLAYGELESEFDAYPEIDSPMTPVGEELGT